jgi:hypothetical protein
MGRKTARRYITTDVALGLDRDGGEGQLTDELIDEPLVDRRQMTTAVAPV